MRNQTVEIVVQAHVARDNAVGVIEKEALHPIRTGSVGGEVPVRTIAEKTGVLVVLREVPHDRGIHREGGFVRIVRTKIESVIDGIAGDVIAYGKIVAAVNGTVGKVFVAGLSGIFRDIV